MSKEKKEGLSANVIFHKTMPFVWAKLLPGVITVVASAVVLAILFGIAWLFKSEGVYFVMFLIWLALTGIIRFVINHYIGFLVKAGHIAVITEAVTTGSVPENQVAYGKEAVKERFARYRPSSGSCLTRDRKKKANRKLQPRPQPELPPEHPLVRSRASSPRVQRNFPPLLRPAPLRRLKAATILCSVASAVKRTTGAASFAALAGNR